MIDVVVNFKPFVRIGGRRDVERLIRYASTSKISTAVSRSVEPQNQQAIMTLRVTPTSRTSDLEFCSEGISVIEGVTESADLVLCLWGPWGAGVMQHVPALPMYYLHTLHTYIPQHTNLNTHAYIHLTY